MSTASSTNVVSDGGRFSLVSASGLRIEASTSASDGVLDEFYSDYDKAFVLENEKEGYDGFAECLRLNEGESYERLARRYGGFREYVLVAREPQTGVRIGGANFIAFPLKDASSPGRTVLSMNLNYVFVNPAFRRRGYFKRLVNDVPDLALRLITSTNPNDVPRPWIEAATASDPAAPQILVFIEQNDPYRMSREDYETDTKFTGLDQIARIGIWTRLGAKIVDFAYVQPPLTSDQEADSNLVYGVLGVRENTLDACLLRGHLERFFGISVLKGADPMREPSAAEQLLALERICASHDTIRLLSPGRLEDLPLPTSSAANRPASLLDALRR